MSTATAKSLITVALIGNPNTGKSTLFTALAGIHQHIGNYPGATVEKRTGIMDFAGRRYELVDLPGLYSLAPRSRDEMVAVDVLLGRQRDYSEVDVVICIVDASNLARNLYLVSQVLELGRPTVLAVNMLDVAKVRGIKLDLPRLQQQLDLPVIGIQANRREGVAELKIALARAVTGKPCTSETVFPHIFERETTWLQEKCEAASAADETKIPMPSFLAKRLLLDSSGYLQRALSADLDTDLGAYLELARQRLAAADCGVPGVETTSRFEWIRRVTDGVVSEPSSYPITYTDKIDRVLTHRVGGLAIFAAVMLVIFQAVFVWAHPVMDAIQTATGALGGLIETQMADGALRSLLVDGIISGVGAVLAFLPQILILYFFIGILEDCGYMARAAFLMDRAMSRIGLSGKSFIPMLSSFACTVPGIMAARVIEDERDRLTTILVSPLLTCSARLPIYALLIAAFIPAQSYLGGLVNLQGLTLAGLYILGIVMAVIVALVLKRTLLSGHTQSFFMELPGYKWPSLRTVALRVGERGWIFIRCAGTLILAMSILVWAGLYFPRGDQSNSFLSGMGRVMEPVVKPLGWDWRIGCSVIASLPAREIVVATLGVMYNLDEHADLNLASDAALQTRLHSVTWDGTDIPVCNIPVALSIMVFFALCIQCAPTLAVMRRETNSWRWPALAFAYMTTLAYLGALITYQVGMRIGS